MSIDMSPRHAESVPYDLCAQRYGALKLSALSGVRQDIMTDSTLHYGYFHEGAGNIIGMPRYARNHERTGQRIDLVLERFSRSVMTKDPLLRRVSAYYQTCGMETCKQHEALFRVDTKFWYRHYSLDARFQPSPDDTLQFLINSVSTKGLEVLSIEGTGPHYHVCSPYLPHDGLNGSAQVVLDALSEVHVRHCQQAGHPVPELLYDAKPSWIPGIVEKQHPSEIVRCIHGVRHTDTDLMLTDEKGQLVLLVEASETENKVTSFSQKLVRSLGGDLALVTYPKDTSDWWGSCNVTLFTDENDGDGYLWDHGRSIPKLGGRHYGYEALERHVLSRMQARRGQAAL